MQRLFISSFLLIFLVSLCGCHRTPKGVLSRTQMENVLVEMHIAEAITDEYPAQYRTPEMRQQLLQGVFNKYGVTKAQFDTSLVYYGANLDVYMKIYDKVSARLEEEQNSLAELLQLYQKSLLTPEGDSVDIWSKKPQLILNPVLLSSTDIFVIKSDSNFKANDRVVWRMRLHQLPADSVAFTYVMLGRLFEYTKVETVSAKPQKNGWVELSMKLPEMTMSDRLFGFVSVLPNSDKQFAPVFIDSISMMRYHDHPELRIDSLRRDSLRIDSLRIDSLRIDSLRLDSLKKDSVVKHPAKVDLLQKKSIREQRLEQQKSQEASKMNEPSSRK